MVLRRMDWELLLGLLAAIAAGVLFNLSIALQALDAREVPAKHSMRLSLMLRLVQRKRWLAASALGFLGWPLQILALQLAPIAVVQPALLVGLVVLLIAGARILKEKVGRHEIIAVLAIGIGVGGATLAAPEPTGAEAGTAVVVTVFAILGAITVVPYLLVATGVVKRTPAVIAIIAAGVGYGFTGLSTKFLGDAFDEGAWVLVFVWLALTGLIALLSEMEDMTALQMRPATYVAPITFVLEMLIPVCLAPILTEESWSDLPLLGIPLIVSILVVVFGTVVLARSPLVGAVVGGADSAPPPASATTEPAPAQ
jgi:drug/metabolite transporter (DMT)-like permease